MKGKFFQKAVPVWQKGRENELHARCVFFATFEGKEDASLTITASNLYRVFVNGNMVGVGPARSAHGRFRVDELPLKNLKEKNVLFIEAVAYNTYNYCHLFQSGFLCAEVVRNAAPIVWTGRDFIVREYVEKKRKVCKFSYQRPFTELYEFNRPPLDTYLDFSPNGLAVEKEYPVQVEDKFFEERGVSYPSYEFFQGRQMETGEYRIAKKEVEANPWLLKERLRIFPKEEWESDGCLFLPRLSYHKKAVGNVVCAGEYILYHFNFALTGFVASEIGRYNLPARYGMTIGEYAKWVNAQKNIHCELYVIELQGWERSLYADQTDLLFVNPSPNIPSVDIAINYNGTCLFEATNVSEGRGTTRPFNMIGAPYVNSKALVEHLRSKHIDGVTIRRAAFTPTHQKYAGQVCEGVELHITDRNTYRPLYTSLCIIEHMRTYKEFEIKPDRLAKLYGTNDINLGLSPETLIAKTEAELENYKKEIKPYLLYLNI